MALNLFNKWQPGSPIKGIYHSELCYIIAVMMKIVIAGTGGLAQYIAHYLQAQTSHHFILLSRSTQPSLSARGWQVILVDYTKSSSLSYALAGADVVISTITDNQQLYLIDAAVHVGVRRFIPAEYEGPPGMRPPGDILDRGRSAALRRLEHYAQYMEYTAIVCGIFYERFSPGGLASCAIGHGSGIDAEGAYLMDIRTRSAKIPQYNDVGGEVHACMTSAQDVAKFIIAALSLPNWPPELRVYGERLRPSDIVFEAELLRGTFPQKSYYNSVSLSSAVQLAPTLQERLSWQSLLATSQGCYDFSNENLPTLIPSVRPVRFREWLRVAWNGA